MSNDVTLDTFPSNRSEALAMLYLKNQDLSGKTPEELSQLYYDTIVRIRDGFRNIQR
ncbi:hypothetical protein ACTWP4_00310 [Gracilibacillus sp. D59]|uniref:hypothetical protein n=1 Tax=Gracilibacillus sp. D59 TaxID=3457434 RepID=UPI003FCC2CB7